MTINEVKELMAQFESSTLREFTWRAGEDSLYFSKNEGHSEPVSTSVLPAPISAANLVKEKAEEDNISDDISIAPVPEGEAVTSPLVGVVYLKAAPDKPDFVKVGDSVKKGQTLVVIEAMKVMNEIPAPKDGLITEILVSAEEVIEYGQELVRIK